jgi:branched-chain amino acid transport system ATP-binding protein
MPAPGALDTGDVLLSVKNLDVFYGRAHVLQGVSFDMGREPVSLIGRNGMGKTTLCNAIMQIRPPSTQGSILFEGRELVGLPSYKVAGTGIGYVPQGRRLFESLTVDEHLRMAAPRGRGDHRWNVGEVYELFPRWPSARRRAARSCRAASSRCSRSGRALLATPSSSSWTSPRGPGARRSSRC